MSSTILDLDMIEDLNEMVAVDETFVENFLNSFFDKAQSLLDEIKEYFKSEDEDSAIESIGKLKSSSKVYGASHMVKQLELATVAGTSETDDAIDRVYQSFVDTRNEAVRLGLISK